MTPLYNHTSIETSYLVSDYPWGFELKTERQYWIHYRESKGYRFCFRTKNPKTGRWCEEKHSTYFPIAMCMYLDEKEHVSYSGLTEYSSAKDIKEFAESFPEAVTDFLRGFAKCRASWYKKLSEKSTDEDQKTRYLADSNAYAEIFP